MKEVLLSKICEFNPSKLANLHPGMLCSFVPMESVSEISGSITYSMDRQVEEVVKGYTPFMNGDVIFAKITPCMENGKCAISTNLKNGIGFGSTEFYVFRAGQETLPEWIYFFLRQDKVRKQAARWFHGTAGQQRVPIDFFKQLNIFIPTLPEQQRIVAILQKADRLRQLRRYARQLSDGYLQSVFLEMFGDPATNPKGYSLVKLGDLMSFMTSGSRGWAEHYCDKGALFLRVQNVGANRLLLNDVAFVNPPDSAESRRTRVKSGDLLISATADIGRTGVIPDGFPEAYINQHLFLIRLKHFNPIFVAGYFSTPNGKAQILQLDREGVKSGLNFDDAKGLTIFDVPLAKQEHFAVVYKHYEQLRNIQNESDRQSEHLFQSLLQRAFQGDL